ncbi:MAG: extracellular solute-binding protein [Geminicoccaceae bacterium]|nr:MAG: extracellular solute-binding protein [Geminicoccaceae bacterium]
MTDDKPVLEVVRSRPGRTVYRSGRRSFLRGAGALAAAAALPLPFVRPSYAARSLRVSTFGGFFEDSFVARVYPAFTEATGIAVESVSQPGNLQFLVQLAEANRAGIAPMDLCTAGQVTVLRGRNAEVWKTLDASRIPSLDNVAARYIHDGPNGLDAVGAMAWFQTLIVNPEMMSELPDSWAVMWDESLGQVWGASSGGASYLFEITANTFFGGNEVLDTEEGVRDVLAKIGELTRTVRVWWESEGTMQTAYENEEIVGGMYYHDVAGIMADEGVPIVSIFPKEGGVTDFGAWAQPSASTKDDEVYEFIAFTTTPEAQALMARTIGVAPLVPREMTDLTDEEFAAVSSEQEPISLAASARVQFEDMMDQGFTAALRQG